MARHAALLGREEELRAVRTALDHGGCVIAGPAGVGKSRLAADAAAGMGPDRTLIRVVATGAARTIPFGAVSHLLVDGSSSTVSDGVAALREGRLGPRPTVLVDDAHLLDDGSAALILAVATAAAAPLLLTLRTNLPAPDAITVLWREEHLARVDLQPLAQGEVEQLVDDLLGARSHAHTYEWVHRLAGGNPLYVTELLRDARRTGRVALHEGRWHLAEPDAPSERLHDLLSAHVGSVPDSALPVLEVLAVGAPMPLVVVEDLVPGTGLEELERSGLAVVRDDPHQGLIVEIAHPLYGELVRDNLPLTAARRIRRELAGALLRHGKDGPADRLTIARLLLESGQVEQERFLAASSIALLYGAPDLARQLAEAVPPSLSAGLCIAQALIGAGRYAEVDAVLAPFEEVASTADEELASSYLGTRVQGLLWGPGDQPARARVLIDRLVSWRDDPDWHALIATVRCWFAVRDRRYTTAHDLVAPSLADPTVTSARRRQLLHAWGLALTRLARVDDYRALMAEIGELNDALGERHLESVMNALRREGGLCAAARDLAGVRQRCLASIEEARVRGEPLEYVGALYLLAHVDHVRGHHAAARDTFERCLDHLVGVDAWNLRPMTHVMLSITLAYLGEADLAQRALEYTERAIVEMPGIAHWVAPDLARARAMVEMAAGRESAARHQLLETAASCGDDVIVASESLHVALLLGADPQRCAAGLEELARDAQDDAVHLWARHARAVADSDPVAQLAAADAFEAAGLDLDAAQAGALAASAFQSAGSKVNASRASALVERCADRCPGVRVPGLAMQLDAPALTARERDIALLVARGASNKAVAEALTLSVRTVETYVLRICRKLGVNDRAGLAEVLGSTAGSSRQHPQVPAARVSPES
jgi:DNA-binding CsgD family transcriptional regulator